MAYRAAIIGFGGMGSWHQENIGKRVERVQVVGVTDVREAPMEKARGLGLKAYPDAQAIFDDADVDLVIIATPNNFHKDLCIRALRAGKHVVCEKPVTLNAAELEEIMAVAEETGKLFSIHQNRRWDKDYRIIKEAREQNLIGEIYFIESKVQGSKGAMHGWRGHKENGGGMVLDWGIHLIDQVMDLIDSPVVAIDAHLFSTYTPEVEDNIKIYLRFGAGESVVLEMSTNCFILQPRWHVCGRDGTLQIDNWGCDGRIVQLEVGGELAFGDDIVYTEAGPTRTMAPRPPETTRELPLPQVHTDWSMYYNNIADVLDGNADLIVRPEQALRVMKVIDTIFESDRIGRGIECEI